MITRVWSFILAVILISASLHAAELAVTDSPNADDFILASDKTVAAIFVETNDEPAVLRAAGDLADDFARGGSKTESPK